MANEAQNEPAQANTPPMQPTAQKPKKPFYKKWWFWVIVVVVVIGVGGAISSGGSGSGASSSDTTTKTNDSATETPTKKTSTYQVGDTIKLKNFNVTVNGVRTGTGEENGFPPSDGNVYFYVDVTIENTSSSERAISSIAMFKIVDKDGRSFDQSITGGGKGQLDGSLGVGRKMTGEYVVEIPEGTTGLELEFNGSFWGGEQVVVSLN